MKEDFLHVLNYFRKAYWDNCLKGNESFTPLICFVFVFFWTVVPVFLVDSFTPLDNLQTAGMVFVAFFVAGLTSPFFAMPWFRSLWVIPAFPCAVIYAFFRVIGRSLEQRSKSRYGYLTPEELNCGYLDFSGIKNKGENWNHGN